MKCDAIHLRELIESIYGGGKKPVVLIVTSAGPRDYRFLLHYHSACVYAIKYGGVDVRSRVSLM
jgi:hypothetical protein